jgi:hypothetical protein
MAELVDNSGRVMFEGTIEGAGGATTVYVQADDPGAVGAGLLWIDTSGSPYSLKVRDALDAAWSQVMTLPDSTSRRAPFELELENGDVNLVCGDGARRSRASAGDAGGVNIWGLGNIIVQVDNDGTVTVLDTAGGVGGAALLALSPGQTAANKNVLAVKNGAGANIFQVRGDGTLHIPAGKALVADL